MEETDDGYSFQSFVEAGRLQVKKVYKDGTEVLEEWEIASDALLMRKSRKPRPIGGFTEWDYELGNAPIRASSSSGSSSGGSLLDMTPSATSNPQFSRSDSAGAYGFRVRNLFDYPDDAFSVFVDGDKDEVVIRTSNKKYYKRFAIPDLKRLGIKLVDDHLSFRFDQQRVPGPQLRTVGTLIVEYKKPKKAVEIEVRERARRQKAPKKDGDVECKQQ
eukprot:ANDGO_04340.mRNA.1 hypothetical protein